MSANRQYQVQSLRPVVMLVFCLVVFITASPAQAQTTQTIYYDRAGFLSDSRVASTSNIHFDSFLPGADLNNQTILGVNFSAPGSTPLQVITASSGIRYTLTPSSGRNVLSPGGNNPNLQDDHLTLTFDTAVQAAGMDVVFDVPDGASYVSVTFFDSMNNVIAQDNFIPAPAGSPGYQFVGLVASGASIKQVSFNEFDGSPDDDNVAYGSLVFSPAAVPEPGVFSLLVLATLGFRITRRQSVA